MPPLTHTVSPISTITGVWAFDDATRKSRVMTPSAHELTPERPVMDGWRFLRRTEYSDS